MCDDKIRINLIHNLTNYYHQSVSENGSLVCKQHFKMVKHFLSVVCAEQILRITNEFIPIYSMSKLQKQSDSFILMYNNCLAKQLVPSNWNDMEKIHHYYNRDYNDCNYFLQNDCFLLIDGPIKSSDQFHRLLIKLLTEINNLISQAIECRFILILMQQPIGEENVFTNTVLKQLLCLIDEIVDLLKRDQILLLDVYDNRARKFFKIIQQIQLNDVRIDFQSEHQNTLLLFQSSTKTLQKCYGLLYQFYVKNQNSIEEIFVNAMKKLSNKNY